MNILVPDSWLREFLKTKASTGEIAKYLSLCSQSVEKTLRKDNDFIYEIEITTNRPDCLSVYGIARELAAILPRFGLKAKLKPIKESVGEISKVKNGLPLVVKIKNSSLCPRFTAIIFDQITYKPSPKLVRDRLEKSGVRALNNIVDISNYLMLELGQPMHTFDYDKVKGAKMTLRESAGGEKLTTLDHQGRVIPEGTIVIEDGEGRIIDLCGIMGGENSAVDEKTRKVLLFVQTYNPMKIRRTCQALGFQTEAAQRFEKGVEPEGVIPAIKKAISMFENNCEARVASNLIDIYPKPLKTKEVCLSQEKLDRIMGIHLSLQEARKILENLGFKVKLNASRCTLDTCIPHWRSDDISIPEDLVEEISRIYGYFNLPSNLPEGQIPQPRKNPIFSWEEQIKDALKYWGFTETVNYSLVSQKLLEKIDFDPSQALEISNPLTEDLVFLRPSLIPSLLEVIAKNQEENFHIQIFEMANIYLSKGNNQLPDEIMTLSGMTNSDDFYKIKGVVEKILFEMGILEFSFEPYILKKTIYGKIFHPSRTAEIFITDNPVGVIGEINPSLLRRFEINSGVVAFDLDFSQLTKYATTDKKYQAISKYPARIEDLAFKVPPQTLVGKMIQSINQTSPLIKSSQLLDSYQQTRTFRITYQSKTNTLTDREVVEIRKKVIHKLERDFQAKLKSKTEN